MRVDVFPDVSGINREIGDWQMIVSNDRQKSLFYKRGAVEIKLFPQIARLSRCISDFLMLFYLS
jgi:hypothetical protein